MVLCARRRELEYCSQCSDFPCTIIDEFSMNGIPIIKELSKI
ncbi:MAG: hypothetical protein DRJ37_01760 [Thermoprotei archaeon]|nr:MAG: hypothetical protein DRJ37_01760 [Thermoprotei archaeon]